MKLFLITASCLFFTFNSFAQKENYAGNYDFFERTEKQYDRWLATKGLDKIIKVDRLALLKDNSEARLLLEFVTNDVDTAKAQWQALIKKFSADNPNDFTALERMLFETFFRQFQVEPAQSNIQISVRDAQHQYITCFYVQIWSENGNLNSEVKEEPCKSKSFDVDVTLPPVKTTLEKKYFSLKQNRDQIFEKIKTYAKLRFEKPASGCTERNPIVEIDNDKSKGNTLQFTVNDLCKVVLKDEGNSILCNLYSVFGFKCNDTKRERLIFTIVCDAIDDNTFKLNCTVTGMFGSGAFKPRVAGYMDMEPDFEDYLKSFVNTFQDDFKKYLNRP